MDRDTDPRVAKIKRTLRPLARRLGLPVDTVYADLRLHPRQWRANLGKVLALQRCVNVCNTRTLWSQHKPSIIESGHLNSLFATERGAAILACTLAGSLDPVHVAKRDAVLLRALLKLLAESFGGDRWGRAWLRRPCVELEGRIPRSIAADAAGFGKAARLLAAELKLRGR